MSVSPSFLFSIVEISDFRLVSPGENAEFFCTVDGNPVSNKAIEWIKVTEGSSDDSGEASSFDMAARTDTYFQNNSTSYLVVKNVSAQDAGRFACIAKNKIGEVKNYTFLLVRGACI